mmetsp:Transcript_22871/g.66033  ORF Transcript_22871/g.66033 Transcript_22871/m.66033 type:complete len:215 (+) Transcript_22871:665-1309(+)
MRQILARQQYVALLDKEAHRRERRKRSQPFPGRALDGLGQHPLRWALQVHLHRHFGEPVGRCAVAHLLQPPGEVLAVLRVEVGQEEWLRLLSARAQGPERRPHGAMHPGAELHEAHIRVVALMHDHLAVRRPVSQSQIREALEDVSLQPLLDGALSGVVLQGAARVICEAAIRARLGIDPHGRDQMLAVAGHTIHDVLRAFQEFLDNDVATHTT